MNTRSRTTCFRRSRNVRVAGLATAVLLSAACGSTVPAVQSLGAPAPGAAVGDGLSGPEGTTDGLSPDGAVATGDLPPGTIVNPDGTVTTASGEVLAPDASGGFVAPGAGAPSAGGGQGAPSSTGGAPAPVAAGPRNTAKIKVGVLYLEDGGSAAQATGVNGLTTGDAKAQARAVFEHANKNGGLAGRPIDAYYYALSPQDTVSRPDAALQEACVAFTQDAKVAFVVSYLNVGEAFLACLAKKKVGLVDDATAVLDDIQAKYRQFVAAPGDLAPGRKQRELVDALWRTGWLTPKSTIGAFTQDVPEKRAMLDKYLKPALKKYGLSVKTEQFGTPESAVLKFASDGVDRVLSVEVNPVRLMTAAESQSYRPLYAVQSGWAPGALLEVAAPRNQLKGAAGIGWSPYLDIGRGKRPPPVSANETLCFKLYQEAGQASAQPTTKALSLQLCNAILYLKAAADRVGHAEPGLLGVAGPAVGASFPPADTYKSDMNRGRTDGVSAYLDLAYQEDCSCFQYVSGLRPTS
jgi:hypothetical protein